MIATSPGGAERVAAEVRRALPRAVTEYEWFHAHPELSSRELKTAARLADLLSGLGMEVHRGIGGHGILAVLRSGGPGPVVLYRADMDGLPVTEATGVKYASKHAGVMHACGHDVHMATAVGTLSVLAALKDSWKGTVLFVGQPAEEIGAGARLMLADGRMKRLLKQEGKPRVALALHDAADLAAGQVSLLGGYATANVDSVDIIIHGKGGHGARPNQAIDPIVIGSEIVLALQTIVSRRTRPGEKAVVTVGKFDAGTKHNIIPSKATLLLTVRSYSDASRNHLLGEIKHIATMTARSHRAPRDPEITIRDEYTPAGYNDPAWTARLTELFGELLGPANVRTHEPSLGGEDFGRYSRALGIPGVQYKLGAVDPRAFKRKHNGSLPGLHSDRWAPAARPTLHTGISTMTTAILDALRGE